MILQGDNSILLVQRKSWRATIVACVIVTAVLIFSFVPPLNFALSVLGMIIFGGNILLAACVSAIVILSLISIYYFIADRD